MPLSLFIIVCLLFFACSVPPDYESPDEDALSQIHVPKGYEVEVAAGPDLVDYPMFATLDETGRLFVFESIGNVYESNQQAIDDPKFRIKLLQDQDGDGKYDQATIFADKLSFPQGGVFYKGSLYASAAPDLLKLTDTDGDGIADQREVILSGWFLNINANSLIGPFIGPDGWLYMTNAIMGFDVTSLEGQRLKGETARIWRVRPDGSDLEWISAGGMNNPVELTFTAAGEVLGTQTFFVYPQKGLRDALTYWVEGGIYGKKTDGISRDQLPLTGGLMPVVSQYSRVAPSGIGRYRGTQLGENFQDNLFSAQFNTHRIIRHQLIREGASFKTEDEDFLWSDNTDFHPTDVLEGGDGSLLMIETGGWFILGCPLSQVSKPQLKGSIYRIRKTKAPKISDPFGNQILWATSTINDLINLLDDPRPFVQDRVIDHLISKGDASINPLLQSFKTTFSAKIRTRIIFALYRIGSENALATLRAGLADQDAGVRIATARVIGLAKDARALASLTPLLKDESLAVRRQAATAIGQIGDPSAIPFLLEVASKNSDRFVSHAITYSLMSLNQPQRLIEALKTPSPNLQKTALIALDQSPSKKIEVEHVVPFLTNSNEDLQQSALWVAAHHPEWSGSLNNYLEERFSSNQLTEGNQKPLEAILTAFCGQLEMQLFIAKQFSKEGFSYKELLLKSMSDCQEKTFPEVWLEALRKELVDNHDGEIKSAIVDLVRLRRLKPLQSALEKEANDPQNPASLRVKAIGAIMENRETFSKQQFTYLLELLQKSQNAALKQQVAITLGVVPLSASQLSSIAGSYLPRADHFILPKLVPLFKGKQSFENGQALVSALMESPGLDNFTLPYLESIFKEYPDQLKPQLDQLFSKIKQVQGERLARIKHLEQLISQGDEGKGRGIYFGKGTCSNCHTMGEDGGHFGPDLTSIQLDRSVHDILEAILYPGVSFVREFETYEVTTPNNTYIGIIQQQSPQAIVLGIGPGVSVRIPQEDISHIQVKDLSLMPQGFGDLLNEEEIVDLVSFLLGKDLNY